MKMQECVSARMRNARMKNDKTAPHSSRREPVPMNNRESGGEVPLQKPKKNLWVSQKFE